jgi:hypothetical protein
MKSTPQLEVKHQGPDHRDMAQDGGEPREYDLGCLADLSVAQAYL